MQKYNFALYKETPSLNVTKRWHWGKTRTERNSWRNEFLIEIPDDATPIEKARITVTSFRGRTLDHDNFVGGLKVLIDGLRDTQLIKNDSKKWLEHGEHRQVIDKSNPCTVVVIEEI